MSDICVVCNCKSEGKPLYKKVTGFQDVEILEALWLLEWSDLTEADKADHYICWDCDEVLAETYTRYLEEQPLKKKKNVQTSKPKSKREEKKKKSKLGRKEKNVPILKISKNYVKLKVKNTSSNSPSKPSYSKLCSKPLDSPVKKCREYDASHCMLCDNVFADVHRGFNRFPLKKMVDDRKDVAQVMEFLGIARLSPGVKNRRFICTTCFQVLRRSYKAKKNPEQDSQDDITNTEECVKKLAIHRASTKEHADEISKLIPPDLADLYKVVTEETLTSSASDSVQQAKQTSLNSSKSNGTLQKMEFEASDITNLQNSRNGEKTKENVGEPVEGENVGKVGKSGYSAAIKNHENMFPNKTDSSNEVDSHGNQIQAPLKDKIKKGIKIHRPVISKYHLAGTTQTPKKTLKVHRPHDCSTEKVDEHSDKNDDIKESSDSHVSSSSSDDEDICPKGVCNICGRTYTGMPYEWWFSLETAVEGFENISLKEALVVLHTGLAEVDESVRKSGLVCRMCCGMVNSGYIRLQGVEVEDEIPLKKSSYDLELSQNQPQKLWKEDKIRMIRNDLSSGEEASEIIRTDDNQFETSQSPVESGLFAFSESTGNNGNESEDGSKNHEIMNPKVVLQDLTPVLPDIAFKYLTVSCEEILGKLNNNYMRRKSSISEEAQDLDMDSCKMKPKSGRTYGMYKCVYCTEKKSKRLEWYDSGDSFNAPGIDVALKWAIVALGKKSRTSTIKERNKVCHSCYSKILVDFKKFLQEQIAKSVGVEVHRVDLNLYQVKVDTNTCNLVIDPVSVSEDEVEGDEEKTHSSSGSEESDSECETSPRKHQVDDEVADPTLVQGKIKNGRNTSGSKQDKGEQEMYSCKSSPLQTGQIKSKQSSAREDIHESSFDGFPKTTKFEHSEGSKVSLKKDYKYSDTLVKSEENQSSPHGTKKRMEKLETESKKQGETQDMIRPRRRGRPPKLYEKDFKEVFSKSEEKDEENSLSDPLEYIDDSDEDFIVRRKIKVTPSENVRTSRRLSEKRGMATGASPSSLEQRIKSYSGDSNSYDQDNTLLKKSIPRVVKKATNIGRASGKHVLNWDMENIYSKSELITEACAHHVFSLLLSIDIDGLVSGHSIPRLKIEEFSKGLLLLLCDLQSHFGAPVTNVGLWLDSLMPEELVSKGFTIDYPSVLKFLETGLENVSDVLVPLPEELYKKIPNMSVESTSLSTVMGCLSAVGLDHLVLGSVTRLTWKDFTHGFVYSLSKFCEMTAINDNLLMDWLQALSPCGMQFTQEDLKNIVAQVDENPQSYQILSKPVFVPKSSLIEECSAAIAATSIENDLSKIYSKISNEIHKETTLHSGHSPRKHVHKSNVIKRHSEQESVMEIPSLKEHALCKANSVSKEGENHIAVSQMESKPDGPQEKVSKKKLDTFDVHNNTREQECFKSPNVISKSREKVPQSDCQSENIEKEETKNKRQKLSLRNLDKKPQCRQDVTSASSIIDDYNKKDADIVIEKRERVESEKCSNDFKNCSMSSVLPSKSRRSSVFKRKKIEKMVEITRDQQEVSERSKDNSCNDSSESETFVYCKRKRKLSDSETKNENSLTDQNKNSPSSSDKGKIIKPVSEKTMEDSVSPKESNRENKRHISATSRNHGNNVLKKRARTFEEALNMGSV